MSPSCRNSWSVLITSPIGNLWNLDPGAANHIPWKASNVAQIVELGRGTIGHQKRGVQSMTAISHPFLARVRGLRAFVAASLRRFLKMEPHDGDFASHRMCPFCGLITQRHEPGCLECGRSFKPA